MVGEGKWAGKMKTNKKNHSDTDGLPIRRLHHVQQGQVNIQQG